MYNFQTLGTFEAHIIRYKAKKLPSEFCVLFFYDFFLKFHKAMLNFMYQISLFYITLLLALVYMALI